MFTICFYTEYRTQSPAARGLNSPAVGPGGATKREWQDGRRQVVRISHARIFARYHPAKTSRAVSSLARIPQGLRVPPRRLLARTPQGSHRRYQMEIACVTGATGFLGSELVAQLLQGGYKVHATVRSLANTERNGCLLSLPGADSARLTLFEANLLDEGAFDGCVAGARYVFHTASPFVTSNISDPELQLIAPALNGTRNVFGSIGRSIATGAAAPRVVLTSSVAAIMGTPADKASCFDESDWNLSSQAEGNPLGHGLDMYRYSKVVAEREAWRLAGLQQLEMARTLPQSPLPSRAKIASRRE